MKYFVNLYSSKENEINRFLKGYYNQADFVYEGLKWENSYDDPIKLADIIGLYIDNKDKYDLSMWISIDPECFICITNDNANEIIKYLYERFPY